MCKYTDNESDIVHNTFDLIIIKNSALSALLSTVGWTYYSTSNQKVNRNCYLKPLCSKISNSWN